MAQRVSGWGGDCRRKGETIRAVCFLQGLFCSCSLLAPGRIWRPTCALLGRFSEQTMPVFLVAWEVLWGLR